jgi:hypothetical protein
MEVRVSRQDRVMAAPQGPNVNDVAGHLRTVSRDIAVERVTGIEPA